MVLAGTDCQECKYFEYNEDNNKITCKARDKSYYYGQYIVCDDREILEK